MSEDEELKKNVFRKLDQVGVVYTMVRTLSHSRVPGCVHAKE